MAYLRRIRNQDAHPENHNNGPDAEPTLAVVMADHLAEDRNSHHQHQGDYHYHPLRRVSPSRVSQHGPLFLQLQNRR